MILRFWLPLLLLVIIYMTGWFSIARLTKRYDVVDSAWGIGFIYVAWVSLALSGNLNTVSLVSAGFVSIWGIRLFGHIANRNWRKSEDDHRYQELRQKWGTAEVRKAYTNVFLLQGVLLILVSLPMIAVATHTASHLNGFIVIGWTIWLAGIIFEAAADWQLARFIKYRRQAGAIMDRGLWRYSRHPNYFGEVVTWWGAGIVALSLGEWWGSLGAVLITFLIVKVSGIPPLEKHYAENKKYDEYRRRTSVFIPLPPRQP